MVNQGDSIFETLQSLRMGELDKWHGLLPGCRREIIERVFGDTGPAPDGAGMLGDALMAFRDYPATRFAPGGFTFWFVDDTAICVQVNSPNLGRSLAELLGAPEAVVPSRLKSFHEQWVYARRRLTAHVKSSDHSVSRIYFYEPTSVDNFLQSSLSRVEIRRIPIR